MVKLILTKDCHLSPLLSSTMSFSPWRKCLCHILFVKMTSRKFWQRKLISIDMSPFLPNYVKEVDKWWIGRYSSFILNTVIPEIRPKRLKYKVAKRQLRKRLLLCCCSCCPCCNSAPCRCKCWASKTKQPKGDKYKIFDFYD